MPFKVQESFEVNAPPARVWQYLIDPAKVVSCIPGAELLESQDERTFLGAVRVKIGPIAMTYKGVVKFTEVDEGAYQVKLVGEAREAGGAGSAKVTMSSKVTPVPAGGSHVAVDAEVDLVGKVVQFGRGMIEEVSRQLFRQFSDCVKQHLETADEAAVEVTSEPTAVRAAPLALRALWAVVARVVMRLIGKKADGGAD